MENKIWYLSTCDTCKRIIKELNITTALYIEIKKTISNLLLKYILESKIFQFYKSKKFTF